MRSAKVPSQGRSPGQYGKDEHGQECESQRRGRHGISIAPHAYEESHNGSSTQGDAQGEQEAHATFFSALFMPSISFLPRGSTMRVCHRSTFRRCEPASQVGLREPWLWKDSPLAGSIEMLWSRSAHGRASDTQRSRP